MKNLYLTNANIHFEDDGDFYEIYINGFYMYSILKEDVSPEILKMFTENQQTTEPT